MRYLAKAGFTQSYTYFTWRNTKAELEELLHRAHRDGGAGVLPAESVRQHAGHPARLPRRRRAAGVSRRACCWPRRSARPTASTAASSCAKTAPSPGTEEYADSEKYQVAHWDWDRPGDITELVTSASTRSAGATPRCSRTGRCRFHATDNPQIIAYRSASATRRRGRAGAVGRQSRSAFGMQHGFVQVPPDLAGIGRDRVGYQVLDLLDRHDLRLARRVELRAARSDVRQGTS